MGDTGIMGHVDAFWDTKALRDILSHYGTHEGIMGHVDALWDTLRHYGRGNRCPVSITTLKSVEAPEDFTLRDEEHYTVLLILPEEKTLHNSNNEVQYITEDR
jgi:hypothetical protein